MKFLESWHNSFIVLFEEKICSKASWYSNHANSYSLHPIKRESYNRQIENE